MPLEMRLVALEQASRVQRPGQPAHPASLTPREMESPRGPPPGMQGWMQAPSWARGASPLTSWANGDPRMVNPYVYESVPSPPPRPAGPPQQSRHQPQQQDQHQRQPAPQQRPSYAFQLPPAARARAAQGPPDPAVRSVPEVPTLNMTNVGRGRGQSVEVCGPFCGCAIVTMMHWLSALVYMRGACLLSVFWACLLASLVPLSTDSCDFKRHPPEFLAVGLGTSGFFGRSQAGGPLPRGQGDHHPNNLTPCRQQTDRWVPREFIVDCLVSRARSLPVCTKQPLSVRVSVCC